MTKSETAPATVQAPNDIQVVEEKIKGMKAMVANIEVTDDATLKLAAERANDIKTLKKFIEQTKEKYTAPAKEIIKQAKAQYEPYEEECDQAITTLKAKAGKYMDEVEAERRRKEESIAKRVESGRLKNETAERKLEEIGNEQKTVKTESGAKLVRKVNRTVEITDRNLVPDEYWIIDEVKLRKVVLAGVEVPGTKIVEEKLTSF